MPITDKTTLALTMRPGSLDELLGLEDAIATLRSKLATGAVPRAFFIKGQYGCGKTTLAHIIAKDIQGPFFNDRPEVEEVNSANYRKLDDMREFAKKAGSYPMRGTYKVIIMDECQQLTKDAQQVLLKELEVPQSPTVWILCTTDPDKVNSGVRDRCFTLTVAGLNENHRLSLINRAAAAVKRTEPYQDFIDAVNKSELTSPRKILAAFEAYNNGTPAKQACNDFHAERSPELFDIAMGIVFASSWTSGYSLPWIKDKNGVAIKYPSVSEQLKKLDDLLKKKPKVEQVVEGTDAATSPDEVRVEDDDLVDAGKEQAARSLCLITTTLLKNKVIKGGSDALKAAQALNVIASCTGSSPFGMEWALIIGGLYRAHLTLTAQK